MLFPLKHNDFCNESRALILLLDKPWCAADEGSTARDVVPLSFSQATSWKNLFEHASYPPQMGFEPMTYRLTADCSNQLSYCGCRGTHRNQERLHSQQGVSFRASLIYIWRRRQVGPAGRRKRSYGALTRAAKQFAQCGAETRSFDILCQHHGKYK